MAKLLWRVKLVAELGTEIVSETEVGRIERHDRVTQETLGLTLEESKRLVAAVQAEMVGAQVTVMGGAFPVVRALRDETQQQGLLRRHIPFVVWQCPGPGSQIVRLPLRGRRAD